MGRQPATRLQLSGYRFLLHRMAHAAVRGDARMLDDPLRAQSLSLVAGCVLAAIAVAGCAVLAFVRPQGILDGADIVMVRDSGALYVRVGDTWHPALNLASARLVAGSAAQPRAVSSRTITAAKRGPTLGIAGAPGTVDPPLAPAEAAWTVCDEGARGATVFVGRAGIAGQLDTGRGVLVTPRSQNPSVTYLLYEGRRARVDSRDRAAVRALHLEGVTPQPVSDAVIAVLPETAPITAPPIPRAGMPSPIAGLAVGTVVRSARPDGEEYHVVLADGLQRVGDVAADLIRFTVAQPGADITGVSADTVSRSAVVDSLPIDDFPRRMQPVRQPVVCADWTRQATAGATTTVRVGESLSGNANRAVALAQADGDAPGLDAVGLPPGRSAFIRSVGVTNQGAASGPLFLVTDLGVAFGVHDQEAGKRLGLPSSAVPAPWPLVAMLPRGPELSTAAASVLRDVTAPS